MRSRLAEGLKRGLEAEGFAVDVASNGIDGLWLAAENHTPAILLDIMLPGKERLPWCAATFGPREDWTPVLMLTAKSGEWDQVEALDTGADDYLTKPFSYAVLVARVRALIRRGGGRAGACSRRGARLDPAAQRRALRGGR